VQSLTRKGGGLEGRLGERPSRRGGGEFMFEVRENGGAEIKTDCREEGTH